MSNFAANPDLFEVKAGDIVIVKESEEERDWWAAQVIHTTGGARDQRKNTLLQVVNVDTGVIQVVNADLIYKVLIKYK